MRAVSWATGLDSLGSPDVRMVAGMPGAGARSSKRLALGLLGALALAACSTTEQAAPTDTTRQLTLIGADFVQPIPGDTGVATDPAPLPAGVTVTSDQRYSTSGRYDLYFSKAAKGPLVVLIPGRTSDKAVFRVAGAALAAKGATVVIPNYRSRDLPPVPQTDLRCAIATAVDGAPKWGADPAKLVLVGVSWGAVPALGEALEGPWKAYEAPTDCLVDPTRVDVAARGVVGVVGQYDFYDSGGPQSEAYLAFSPFSQVSSARKVPIRLIHGAVDDLKVAATITERFSEALQSAGFDVVTEISSVPNLALVGTRYDKSTKTAVPTSTINTAALEPLVRLTLALAG